MAGLLDGLTGGSGPSLNIVPLDPGTQNLIKGQIGNSTQNDATIAEKLNSGVAAAGQQGMQSSDQLNQRAAQTGENPASLEAIRRQYNKVAGDTVASVVRNNQTNAAMTRANWMNQAARSMLAQQQVQTQNYQMLTQAMNAADAARAQILSNVLGVGGMAAGMALAPGRARAPRQSINGSGDSMEPNSSGEIQARPF